MNENDSATIALTEQSLRGEFLNTVTLLNLIILYYST